MADQIGESIAPPDESLVPQQGNLIEYSTLNSLGETPQQYQRRQVAVESKPNRLDAVASGTQPSYGKRAQLILDGLNDPALHLSKAQSLQHPFDSETTLKPDHRQALQKICAHPEALLQHREATLQSLRVRALALSAEQVARNKHASWTARALGTKINTVLMEQLQQEVGLEDLEVPNACLQGLGILGKASCSPFFDEFQVPPSISQEY